MASKKNTPSTAFDIPVGQDRTPTAGQRCPAPVQDARLPERLVHCDRERIPQQEVTS